MTIISMPMSVVIVSMIIVSMTMSMCVVPRMAPALDPLKKKIEKKQKMFIKK